MSAVQRARLRPGSPTPLLVTWAAFQEAIALLSRHSWSDPIDFVALGMTEAKAKQVKQTMRCLGLISQDNLAQFRLRRLVQQSEPTALMDALAEHLPGVVGPIINGAPPDEVSAALAELGGTASSRRRCGRFIERAMSLSGSDASLYHDALVNAAGRDAPTSPTPRGTMRGRGDVRSAIGAHNRVSADAAKGLPGAAGATKLALDEAAIYQDALRLALERQDFKAAGHARSYLAQLRKELRQSDFGG